MKKILILIFSIMLVSCEDALVENPKSIAAETFYNSKADFEAAVAAIYAPLNKGGCIGGRYQATLSCMVDYAQGRGSVAILSEFQELGSTNANRVYGIWKLFYKSIRNANIVIARVEEANDLTEDEALGFIGEAKFLRALVYFAMVRNWGGVPIRTEENMSVPDVARSSVAEVYELIEQDLLFAEGNLPETPALMGKPSKWAAKTVLADVYFYQARYSEAVGKALEVINSEEYALVPVTVADDFGNIFGPEVNGTSEEIFYLKFSRSSNRGNTFVRFINHPSTGFHADGGNYLIYSDKVSNPVMSNWDQNDLRYAYGWYDLDIGFGKNTILCKKFIDPNASAGYPSAGNDYPWYRYADLLLLYAEAACHVNDAPTPDAMEKLNMVHRRAYGYDPLSPSAVDFQIADYTKESFIDLVIQERGYETQMESKRWLDLKRSGKVKEIILEARGKEVADKFLLWPIPPSEIEFNKLINPEDQNPGY